MAGGDVDSEIVESPITEVKIENAMIAVRAAVKISTPIKMASFNQGRSVIVYGSIDV